MATSLASFPGASEHAQEQFFSKPEFNAIYSGLDCPILPSEKEFIIALVTVCVAELECLTEAA